MAIYERRLHLQAPLDSVWEFHATTDGLQAITPGWLGLTVESVTGPDGEPDPTVLEAGSQIELSARPWGGKSLARWISVITDRQRAEERASFTDMMKDGPFPHWKHTHIFTSVASGTLITDHVEYTLPGCGDGALVELIGSVGLDPMFRYRHRETRRQLE